MDNDKRGKFLELCNEFLVDIDRIKFTTTRKKYREFAESFDKEFLDKMDSRNFMINSRVKSKNMIEGTIVFRE